MLEHLFFYFSDIKLDDWLASGSVLVTFVGLVVGILVLGKSADRLVDDATQLSLRFGIPQVIVGATIVSLGTTMPEAVVSVLAALKGQPEIALGNAVGSVICDTGLILGLACLIAPIHFNRWLVNRQGIVQFGAGVLLVVLCVPWIAGASTAFTRGGVLPRWAGILFLCMLGVYIVWSVVTAKTNPMRSEEDDTEDAKRTRSGRRIVIGLLIATFFVVISSEVLIATARDLALRLSVPVGVVAATIVAFGTSLPELVIAVTASLRGRSELAIGNVIGADILNVLFVAGAAAAVTPSGLFAAPVFFKAQFPAMLAVLITFRIAIVLSRNDTLARWAGVLLVGFYVGYLAITIAILGVPAADSIN